MKLAASFSTLGLIGACATASSAGITASGTSVYDEVKITCAKVALMDDDSPERIKYQPMEFVFKNASVKEKPGGEFVVSSAEFGGMTLKSGDCSYQKGNLVPGVRK
jgi:hypothetical protein